VKEHQLSKRERQIMDVVYSLGSATASQVLERLENPPSCSSVRTFLTILESRGHLRHKKTGKKYIYEPTRARQNVGKSALQRVLDVFFAGSLESAVSAHLLDPKTEVSKDDHGHVHLDCDVLRHSDDGGCGVERSRAFGAGGPGDGRPLARIGGRAASGLVADDGGTSCTAALVGIAAAVAGPAAMVGDARSCAGCRSRACAPDTDRHAAAGEYANRRA
jgi:predicted transcriptional regulator